MSVPESRARAIAWAREVVADRLTVFLDTETTGLGEDAEICDIAVVGMDGTVLLDRLVKPTGPIPPAASAVHGITDEMVADAPGWPEIWPLVDDLFRERRVCVYNATYDLRVIEECCIRHEQHSWWTVDLDLMVRDCAMRAYAEFDGTPSHRGGLKWHKLDVAAARFGIPPGGHRALGDAETTRQVVLAMATWQEPLASAEILRDLRRAAMLRHHLSSDQLTTLAGPLDGMSAAAAAAWLAYFERTPTTDVRQRLAIASLAQPPLFTEPVRLNPDRFTR